MSACLRQVRLELVSFRAVLERLTAARLNATPASFSATVDAFGTEQPWNALIQAIAAHHLRDPKEEEAFERWDKLKGDNDRRDIGRYIGDQVDAFLNARAARPQGEPAPATPQPDDG